MKAFFSNMTFPRVVILICVLGGAALAGVVKYRGERLDRLKYEVGTTGPKLAREIQEQALRVTQLHEIADKEGLHGQDDPQLYIQKIAQQNDVRIGDVNITPNSRAGAIKGVVDRTYTIKPSDRQREFSRHSISNFLFELERQSRRVRVTHVRIYALKPTPPQEPGSDRWTFEATVTSRQPEGA